MFDPACPLQTDCQSWFPVDQAVPYLCGDNIASHDPEGHVARAAVPAGLHLVYTFASTIVNGQTSVVFSSQRLWCTLGAVLAGLAVVSGAFGAHYLDAILVEVHKDAGTRTISGAEVPAAYKYLQDFKTGATYQMTHALAIIATGLLGRRGKARFAAHGAGICFFLGIVLFSGSLYILATTGVRWLGMVTPFGGMLFIIGWLLFATASALPRTGR